MLKIFFVLLGLLSGVCLINCSAADIPSKNDIFRISPPIYKKILKNYLCPFEQAIKKKSYPVEKDADKVLVYSEVIRYVTKDGKYYRLLHNIEKALTPNGTKDISKQVFHFQIDREKIFLISASTIPPDQERLEVGQDACMLKIPQLDEDSNIYDDYAQLIIIPPRVKVGSMVEYIVLIEQEKPYIENEFSASILTNLFYPIMHKKAVLEIPGNYASRLKINNVGQIPASPDKETLTNGRCRYTWNFKNLKAVKYEFRSPPLKQAGPLINITTIKDWAVFNKWYCNLLKDVSTLNADTRAEIDMLTKGADSKKDIFNLLLRKVTDDVRYVGIEIGIGGYKPHDCNYTWKNRYGDCKDKANLLRALLKYKNIPAHIVLLNTVYNGKIHKSTPSYHAFNHAILAVELEKGKCTFCDPTVKFLDAASLPPDDSGREVFVVNSEDGKFVYIPPRSYGDDTFDFDIKVDDKSAMSGWLHYRTCSYLAALEQEACYSRSVYEKEDYFSNLIKSFFKQAQLIDYKISKEPNGIFAVNIYFTTPPLGKSQNNLYLSFSEGGRACPRLGTDRERTRDYYQYIYQTRVNIKYHVPTGFGVMNLPADYSASADAMKIRASWRIKENNVYCANFLYDSLKNNLSPKQYQSMHNAVKSLYSWLDTPLCLVKGKAGPIPQVQKTDPLKDFPIMPTGAGQLRLIESKFPHEGNTSTRRLALQKTIQWFKANAQVVSEAKLMLVRLLIKEKKYKEAFAAAEQLYRDYKHTMTADTSGWTQLLMGSAMTNIDKTKAEPYFKKMIADPQIASHWKGWASCELGDLCKKNPEKASKYYKQALGYESSAYSYASTNYVYSFIDRDEFDKANEAVRTIEATQNPENKKVFRQLLTDVNWYLNNSQSKRAVNLFNAIKKLANDKEEYAEALKDIMPEVAKRIDQLADYDKIKKDIIANADNVLPQRLKTLKFDKDSEQMESCLKAIKQYEETDADKYIIYALKAIKKYPVSNEFIAEKIWRIAQHLQTENRNEDEKLLLYLLSLTDKLPISDDYYFEGRIVRHEFLKQQKKYKEALDINLKILNGKLPNENFKPVLLSSTGEDYTKLKQYDKALEYYNILEKSYPDRLITYNYLLNAIYINLNLKRYKEACRLISLLKTGLRSDDIKQLECPEMINNFLLLAANPEQATAYWEKQDKVKKIIKEFLKKYNPGIEIEEIYIPEIESYEKKAALYGQHLRANDKKEAFKVFVCLIESFRWVPQGVNTFEFLFESYAQRFEKNNSKDFLDVKTILLENFAYPSDNLQSLRDILLAVVYIDSDEMKKAEAVFKNYFASRQNLEDDKFARIMVRLWGVFAAKHNKHSADARKKLLTQLANAKNDPERGRAVMILADLYNKSGMNEKELELLKSERNNPIIKKFPDLAGAIEKRYNSLNQEYETSRRFSAGVKEWIKTQNIFWLKYIAPQNLKELQNKDIDTVLKNINNDFSKAELFKIRLLAAMSNDCTFTKKLEYFNDAVSIYVNSRHFLKEQVFARENAADIDNFDDKIRKLFLWRAITLTMTRYNKKILDRLRTKYLNKYKHFPPRQEEVLKKVAYLYDLDLDSTSDLEKGIELILSKPFDRLGVSVFPQFILFMISRGETAKAKEYIKRLKDIVVDSDAGTSKMAFRLEMLKALKRLTITVSLYMAAYREALKFVPEKSIKKPDNWDDFIFYNVNMAQMDAKESLNATLYMLKTGTYAVYEVDDLKNLIYLLCEVYPDKTDEIKEKIFSAILNACSGDKDIFMGMLVYMSFRDIDKYNSLDDYLGLIKKYDQPGKDSMPALIISLVKEEYAIRKGQKVNLDSTNQVDSSVFRALRLEMKLVYYLISKNKAKLEFILNNLSTDDMISKRLICSVIKAMEFLNKTDELELLRPIAEKRLRHYIADVWLNEKGDNTSEIIRLVKTLKDNKAINKDFIKLLREKIDYQQAALKLEIFNAEMAENWPLMLDKANELVRESESDTNKHNAMWYKGLALYKLGRREEALKALKSYAKYAKNELKYPEAEKLISELE